VKDLSIVDFKQSYSTELLRLLLELHSTYFHKKASKQIQGVRKEKNIKKSYRDYISSITQKNNSKNWKILLAVSSTKRIVGFIIGSIETDNYLVKNKIGKFEDWFVEDDYRGKGMGLKLYNELEKWFKEKGCQQVMSDTWYGNELSIKAHKKLGFFISGFSFGKKI
jgi:RimJ/RimL family protein N-acetyltransferase